MKRVISLFLILSFCVCYLSSCGNFTATTTLAKAEKQLTENSYTVTMSVDYQCDDVVVDVVLNAFVQKIPAVVNGGNIYIDMSAETTGSSTGFVLTVADDVLYAYSTIPEQPTKYKTMLQGDYQKKFLRDTRIAMPVGVNDFENITLTTANDKQIITCKELTPEGAATMIDMISTPLTLLGATAAVKDLTMVATVTFDKYESVVLTATYLVTQKDETHTVELTMAAHYNYEDVDPIKAPADADAYTWVAYKSIIGG